MAASIVDSVRAHAISKPAAAAFVFVRRHDDPGETLTWAELWSSAGAVAAAIPAAAGPRPAAFLCCSDEKAFVIACLAAWRRGLTIIPAAGGFTARIAERNRHILLVSKPDIVLHDLPAQQLAELERLAPQAAFVSALHSVSDQREPEAAAAEGGLLQFTSGSTSAPKAVLLSAREIESNCAAIARSFAIQPDDVVVHWLPLFHDMGLVGSVLIPLFTGCTSVILRTIVFMQRPAAWLEHLARWRGAITSAPNFAYERLCDACKASDLAALDLSRLRSIIFGGEPVLEGTVSRLCALLAACGVTPGSIAPAYGMAEVTLLVSSGQRPEGALFERRHTTAATACVGPGIAELEISLRDPETGAAIADGAVGEIWLSGASAGQILAPEDDWRNPPRKQPIRTGDFGYLVQGQLFITGRSARKLIIRGKNVFAEDVERLVQESQPSGLIAGVAAIGLDSGGSQQLCILVEIMRRKGQADLAALNAAVVAGLGVKPARIVTLRAGTLPRTSSGKIRHDVARRQFLTGAFEAEIIGHAIQTHD